MILGNDNFKKILRENGFKIVDDKAAQAVLVGKMNKIDLQLLKLACGVLLDGQKLLCGINLNRLVVDDDSRPYPGPGAIIKMLEYAVNYNGKIIYFGKGSKKYDEILINRLGLRWKDFIMASDDPYTDLKHYQAKGCIGVFVTTGKYKRSQLRGIVPHMVVDDIMDVFRVNKNLINYFPFFSKLALKVSQKDLSTSFHAFPHLFSK